MKGRFLSALLLFFLPVTAGAVSADGAESLAASAVDTFLLVHYDFEPMDWQGWTQVDNTVPMGSSPYSDNSFWHVEDFLEPCFAGRAAPLEGSKSMWCGLLPGGSEYLCSWQSAPGYGNDWRQTLSAYTIKRCSPLNVSFLLHADIEEGKDFLHLEAEMGYDGYERYASFTGRIDSAVTVAIPGAYVTKLRFVFETDGSGSDEDGLYASDCSVAIDSVYMESLGGGYEHFEDFDSYDDGAVYTSRWYGSGEYPFGKFSGLYNNMSDLDPCNDDFGSQIVFFIGSSWPSADYPDLYDTPHCFSFVYEDNPCQDEMVVSPPIDISRYSTAGDEDQDADIPPGDLPALGGAQLRFKVYRDLPLENLVFYRWHVRGITGGCPGPWLDRGLAYHGDEPEYCFAVEEIGDLITTDTIQVALGVVDMCQAFFDECGECGPHTPAPWFDDVSVVRYDLSGPQWYVEDIHLFQDNFPSGLDIESFVRADMAMDLRPAGDPVVDPGDSIVVTCTSPQGGGIASDGAGPRVYMHVKCDYIGFDGLKSDLSGPSLEGDLGDYVSDDGAWTIFRADSARIGAAAPAPDRYAFDLNDSLLTRGYMIEYYFKAWDNDGQSSTLPAGAESTGDYPYYNGSHLFEFTCLPTQNNSFLFVDGYDGIGCDEGLVQLYFEAAFDAYAAGEICDRFDRLGPLSGTSNTLAGRARLEHLSDMYRGIYWDCGDISSRTIPDGDPARGNKTDDCGLLADFLYESPFDVGVVIAGANVATDLAASTTSSASDLMDLWGGVILSGSSYMEATGGYGGGGNVNPLMTGLDCLGGIDFYLFGGCPDLQDFDVLDKAPGASFLCAYPDYDGTSRYAVVKNDSLTGSGDRAWCIWFGFSFKDIRSGGLVQPRADLLQSLLRSCANIGPTPNDDITGGNVPAASFLAQNYPNPFNPATTIRFGLKSKGHVRIRVYDVTGRPVATVVDGVMEAGFHSEVWEGRDDGGGVVASGVYFLRMECAEFESSRKLVLLR